MCGGEFSHQPSGVREGNVLNPWKTLNFQKLRQVYILRLAKKLYPKWLKVSGPAVGLSQLSHDC